MKYHSEPRYNIQLKIANQELLPLTGEGVIQRSEDNGRGCVKTLGEEVYKLSRV